jgi:hypothetical protein
MKGGISLYDLRGAYERVSSRIYRILEDGYDFAVDDRIIDTLNRDALIVDAAFLVLIFGQIENRLNELALQRAGAGSGRRRAMREEKFEKRLDTALPGPDSETLRRQISGWYDIRSDAAHGERLNDDYNVATVFTRAFELETLVAALLDQPHQQGDEPR